MKIKTITFISLILILVLGLTFTAFSRGRNRNLVKIQLDSNTYEKVEPAIKNLYESLKNLVNKEVSVGIISNYYGQNLISSLDSAYAQISKTKTIYLSYLLGFGPRGPKSFVSPAGQPNQMPWQGPQNNQGGQAGNPPFGYGQGSGLNYQNQLTEAQINAIKSITGEVLKVVDAETNLFKTLKDAAIITDFQLSTYLQRLDFIKQNLNQFPLIHYGIMKFIMLAGFIPNN